MTTQDRPVVVGIDGTHANRGALRYAVQEAQLLGVPLKLVHVVPDRLQVSPLIPLVPEPFTEPGTRIVRDAEEDVAEIAPDVDAVGWVYHGSRAVRLAEGAERGSVLVVGRDDRPLAERLLRGDTATGAAARARVPVVEVPSDWTAETRRHDVVVVGLKAQHGVDPLLDDAFEVAERRGATLRVLHAWWLPSGYDDLVESQVVVDDWRRRSTLELEDLLRPWRERHPAVKVELQVVHAHAGAALVDASDDADLVVIARRRRGIPAATHLGGTARAVLRASHCPVRVVPPRADQA